MRIAVTTPTGHVGRVAADYLLEFGGDIRVLLLGRRPANLKPFVERGAEVAVGSQDDADYLIKATRDVDALFWVTPPGHGSDKQRAYKARMGKAVATAVKANQIPRVVNLSSVGAQYETGVGPVNGLHDVEEFLNSVAQSVIHLRPSFFFENLLLHLDSFRRFGRFSLPVAPSRRLAMIATRDVGRIAALKLVSRNWSGQSVNELLGPTDLSYDDVARILSETLGRKIVYSQCDPQQSRRLFIEHGMSENAADAMLELYQGIEAGLLRPTQPRGPQTSTPTSLGEFAQDVMLPLLREEAQSRFA
jgi:uncharacterized protein YbjT (DUF2867 family)